MSLNSPESDANEPSSRLDKRDAPRKRSKVSRACDACRRKKVRCNAEFSSSLSRVVKICTNCLKVGDECLFSRVPLKRGPSKGYLKELSDRLENSTDADLADVSLSRPRSKSIDVAGYSAHGPSSSTAHSQAPLSPMSSTHAKPLLHRLKFQSTSATKSPIILPPLLGGSPNVSISHAAYPGSSNLPGVGNHGVGSPDSRPQVPFWKVPYEMPASSGPGSNSSSPGALSRNDFDSRRSSVDSVSSVSTSGSRSRMTSFTALGAPATDGPTTSPESEDVKTGTNSPRNSVSSLSSLNGRMTRNLQINNEAPEALDSNHRVVFPTVGVTNGKPSVVHRKSVSLIDPKHAAISTVCPIPLNSLDHNLSVYYAEFHSGFPILPTERSLVHQALSELSSASSVCLEVAQLFNAALNNLVNCQFISLDASKSLLLRTLSAYPLQIFIPTLSEKVLMIYAASLVLINYAIAVRGECFSIGISSTLGVFNDLDVLKNFRQLKTDSSSFKGLDDMQIYIPHLYLCLGVLDSCYALSFGKQLQVSTFLLGNSEVLAEVYSKTIPESWFFKNFPIAKLIRALAEIKDSNLLAEGQRSNLSLLLSAPEADSEVGNFSRLFGVLLKETYSLHDFLMEVSDFLHLNKANLRDDDDEVVEHVHDYHLKTSRLVKKLSQSILNYANYVSSSFFQARSPNGTEFTNPFYNISYGRALHSIKLSKSLIDLLTKHVRDGELFNRSLKINHNLSIAFNLLMGNLNNNFNVVSNAKTLLNHPNKLSPPTTGGMYGLGICCMNALSKNVFELNFSETSPMPSVSGSRSTDINAWRSELVAITKKYVVEDLQAGWL